MVEGPLTPDVRRQIEKLLEDKKEEYSIPSNIRFYIVDNRDVPDHVLPNAISWLLIGKRIRSQAIYDVITAEINAITEPHIVLRIKP